MLMHCMSRVAGPVLIIIIHINWYYFMSSFMFFMPGHCPWSRFFHHRWTFSVFIAAPDALDLIQRQDSCGLNISFTVHPLPAIQRWLLKDN